VRLCHGSGRAFDASDEAGERQLARVAKLALAVVVAAPLVADGQYAHCTSSSRSRVSVHGGL